ncbi:MAG: FKBP-type peptidyl-prolyl cis-trans isomerase [Spirochaetes bacterium]|uniref:Peptidyl-prolyl cis-trans isomerase n=1 Tax=Candidatus Ornithospirochaeta stercoripullorum TaxID=2840899 RepID=A0A9D9H622_9SPIO|nr:FKBP-type peptidyl-prolyl cis-trans isomerase [Candidatus Ornithospirochaeta stercoripullorum]
MLKKVFLLLFAAVLLVSCSRGNAVSADEEAIPDVSSGIYSLDKPAKLEDSFSYVFGYMLASSAGIYKDIDYQYVARGVLDYSSGSPFFSSDEMSRIASEYQRSAMAEVQERLELISRENLAVAESFLNVNGQRNGVVTTDSGLQYEILESGNGKEASPDSTVTLHYKLTLLDGTLADSSYERGEPSVFNLADMIPGFREGVALMKVGDRYRFWIPPELGYGLNAPSGIGPNSLLIFDVNLLGVED